MSVKSKEFPRVIRCSLAYILSNVCCTALANAWWPCFCSQWKLSPAKLF